MRQLTKTLKQKYQNIQLKGCAYWTEWGRYRVLKQIPECLF